MAAGFPIASRTRKTAMPKTRSLLILSLPALLTSCAASAPAFAQSWTESWFDNATYSSPAASATRRAAMSPQAACRDASMSMTII
jgi:hypothetical protein